MEMATNERVRSTTETDENIKTSVKPPIAITRNSEPAWRLLPKTKERQKRRCEEGSGRRSFMYIRAHDVPYELIVVPCEVSCRSLPLHIS